MTVRRYEASFTVEAAFIFPVVVYAIIGIIFFSYYLCNRITLKADIHNAVMDCEQYIKYGTDFDDGGIQYINLLDRSVLYSVTGLSESEERRLEQRIIERLRGRYFYAELAELQLKTDMMTIDISAVCRMKLPVPAVISTFLVDPAEIRVSVHRNLIGREEVTRLFTLADRLASDIGTIRKCIEKFKSFMSGIR